MRRSPRSSSAPTMRQWSRLPLGTCTPSPILTTLRSMPTPRGRLREPSQIGALAVVALAATLLLIFAAGHRDGLKTEPAAAAAAGAGIYPVRVGYPATLAPSDVRKAMRRAGAAARPPGLTLPGFNGRGVTVALLDTGVDQRHAYLRRSIEPGTDIVSGAGAA